ncbi:hypothetical protein BB934_38095 (plasmid) [Microvirga ossetica]|uniref:IclR family transcriptional regulator n=1 Tax=Microvirga ossetica TaxID=1882682 RepID=A0A1B2EVU4_9HYPH|nr:IclR family transcriptional regulator [Microvirga ossetica]ANY84073.1 hypothetical protein BB934_38095 [Microvirga ossetica]
MDDGAVAAIHRIPVIDKMMTVLFALEGALDGASAVKLARDLKLSRTTVYRMLNTLAEHGIVTRHPGEAVFSLGPTLVRLARQVPTPPDLASVCRPYIEDLAAREGRTVKVSIRDRDEAVVIGVALGSGPFSIAAQVGRRFPLHAGAASKLLLAYAGEQDVHLVLSRKLFPHTDTTIVDKAALRHELAEIRSKGWAEDRGEFVQGVRALAAPIHDAGQRVVAALSITFVANAEELSEHIVPELLRTAEAISRRLGA